MTGFPKFPDFRPIELKDRDIIQDLFRRYQPEVSELTFTNLFIWRRHYGFQWSLYDGVLLVVGTAPSLRPFALPPVGTGDRTKIVLELLAWLQAHYPGVPPCLERVDSRLTEELADLDEIVVDTDRAHFDYVYRTEDLRTLAGRKYHSKRNHINKLKRLYEFDYLPITARHAEQCLALAGQWCRVRRCDEDLNLSGEWEAIQEIFAHFDDLAVRAGGIMINGVLQAFSVGELLNQNTAVVHVEKANAEIPGLYALINQQFCDHAWPETEFVNREQDLGEPGLRKAKLSYHPHHLVKKFRIRLKSAQFNGQNGRD